MLFQIAPPSPTLYLTISLFALAGLSAWVTAVYMRFWRGRGFRFWLPMVLVGAMFLIGATRYAQLTVPWFPGFPIPGQLTRPTFLLIAIGCAAVTPLVLILERVDARRQRLVADNARLAAEREQERLERIREREEIVTLREELLKEKEDFVAVALHEINTPLTLLTGYVQMMVTAGTLDEARDHAQSIARTTGRFFLMKMLFDARLHRLHLTAFDLCHCVEAALRDPYLFVATRKEPGDVEIQADCEPLTVEADYEKVRVAILELVRNGLKATEPGGCVTVTISASNGHFIVTVEDDGVGIPSDFLPRIWEPGSQYFEQMMTRRNEGAGYGLYTVRHVAEAHNGSAELEWTALGEGSRFALYLPRR